MDLGNTFRRLPVYLVIDTSASMAGPAMAAVNEGLKIFERVIRDDPQCRETVHASIIRFSSDASQLSPLTEAAQFVAPTLTPSGGTALSRGLAELRAAVARELKPKSGDYPGDYKPLVFLLTDGEPNPGDDWAGELTRLHESKGRRPGLLVVIGAGPGANRALLQQLAPESHYMMEDLDDGKVKALFTWIANSTVVASRAAGQGGGGQVLPDAPPNLFSTNP